MGNMTNDKGKVRMGMSQVQNTTRWRYKVASTSGEVQVAESLNLDWKGEGASLQFSMWKRRRR